MEAKSQLLDTPGGKRWVRVKCEEWELAPVSVQEMD